MAVFCPSYLHSRVKSTVRIGTLMPTPERVRPADDLEQAALRELLDEHAVFRQQPGVVQPDAVPQPAFDLRSVGAGETVPFQRVRDGRFLLAAADRAGW